jgi:hypothetical protein
MQNRQIHKDRKLLEVGGKGMTANEDVVDFGVMNI